MAEVKTSRPFQERFLDGYDRSQLRVEVQKVKPRRWLRKKYATWALGGALALGSIGIPLKVGNMLPKTTSSQPQTPPKPSSPPEQTQIAADLNAAKQIADQVAGGVEGAVTTVADTAKAAPEAIAKTVVEAPQKVADVAEHVKENFFRTQVPFGASAEFLRIAKRETTYRKYGISSRISAIACIATPPICKRDCDSIAACQDAA